MIKASRKTSRNRAGGFIINARSSRDFLADKYPSTSDTVSFGDSDNDHLESYAPSPRLESLLLAVGFGIFFFFTVVVSLQSLVAWQG